MKSAITRWKVRSSYLPSCASVTKFVTVFGALSASSSASMSPFDVWRMTSIFPERSVTSVAVTLLLELAAFSAGGVSVVRAAQDIRKRVNKRRGKVRYRIPLSYVLSAPLDKLFPRSFQEHIRDAYCCIWHSKSAEACAKSRALLRILHQLLHRLRQFLLKEFLWENDSRLCHFQKMRVLLLMTMRKIREGDEDGHFSQYREFRDHSCTGATDNDIGEGIEVLQFFMQDFPLPVPCVCDLRVQFPFTCEVQDIAEEDELFQILADGSIQCGCSLAPADHEEHGTFAGKSRHSPSAI